MIDPVKRPLHYIQGRIEVIEFIVDQKLGYRLGNAIKYICRCRHKGNMLQDLKKARQYIDFVIDELEGRTSVSGEFKIEPFTQEIEVSESAPDDLPTENRGDCEDWERRIQRNIHERGEEEGRHGGAGVDTPCWDRCASIRRVGSKIAKSTGGNE